ncbi:MAG: hypothetical protein HY403_02125 [Elusimicrobia bacterium]|nr:hypothetical protein [Elusimicrobiota bacterium]
MAGALAGRLRFASPPKSRLLIFDAMGSAVLERTALKDLPHAVLPARGEVFHLSPAVLVRMLRYAGHIDWALVARRGGRGLFGQLYLVHLLACVDVIAPEVVVTWIDNSWLFHKISRAYPQAEFYAVQNGSRSLGCVTSNLPLKIPGGYVISMPNLLCFGRYEEDLYRGHGHVIDSFHRVGPLLGGFYLSRRGPAPAPKYDLCLVSQWRADLMIGDRHPEVKGSVTTLAGHLGRYAKERGVRVCVAARTTGPAERVFYQAALGADVPLITRRDELMSLSTYQAIDESSVAVGFSSTALLEAFGWGKRALFCNFFKHSESYSPPRPGPWMVDEPRYELFRDKLDALRAMTPAEYEAAAGEFTRYAVRYDPAKPAHIYLRELIESRLSRGGLNRGFPP